MNGRSDNTDVIPLLEFQEVLIRFSLRTVLIVSLVAAIVLTISLTLRGYQGFVYSKPVWLRLEFGNMQKSLRIVHGETVTSAPVVRTQKYGFYKITGDDFVLMASKDPGILILFTANDKLSFYTSTGTSTGNIKTWARAREKIPSSQVDICRMMDSLLDSNR